MRSVFKRAFCLHEWVNADSIKNPYPKIRYSIGSRMMYVCKKCGKTTFYPNY